MCAFGHGPIVPVHRSRCLTSAGRMTSAGRTSRAGGKPRSSLPPDAAVDLPPRKATTAGKRYAADVDGAEVDAAADAPCRASWSSASARSESDDRLAVAKVKRLLDRLGFDPVDAGPLKNGLALEPDGSPIAITYSADQLSKLVSR